MPTLKDINCSIELAGTYEKLREYGVSYSDGVVEAFIPIPTNPRPFTVHLTSMGYVAPGLAMFVYIDGVYQCNRNRQGLIIPDGTESLARTLVDFRVRQKEETRADGRFMGREWNFEKLNVVSADEALEIPPDVLYAVGSIEVIVLRCTGDIFTDGTLERISKLKTTPQKLAQQAKKSGPATRSVPRRRPTLLPAKSENGGSVGGLFGLFDGAGDSPTRTPSFFDGWENEGRRSRNNRGSNRNGTSVTYGIRSPLDIPRTYNPEWQAERSAIGDRIDALLTRLRSENTNPNDVKQQKDELSWVDDAKRRPDEMSWTDERAHPRSFQRPSETYAYASLSLSPTEELSLESRESQRRHKSRPRHLRKIDPHSSDTDSDSSAVVFVKHRRSSDISPKRRIFKDSGWASSKAHRPSATFWGGSEDSRGRSKDDTWGHDDDDDDTGSWISDATVDAAPRKSGNSRRKNEEDGEIKDVITELKKLKRQQLEESSSHKSESRKRSREVSRRASKSTHEDSSEEGTWEVGKNKETNKGKGRSDKKEHAVQSSMDELMKRLEALEGLGSSTTKIGKESDGWGTGHVDDSWADAGRSKNGDNNSTTGWGNTEGAKKGSHSGDQGWSSGNADANDSWGSDNENKEKKDDGDGWTSGWNNGHDQKDSQDETGGNKNDEWEVQSHHADDNGKDDGWNAKSNDKADDDQDNGWGSNDNQDKDNNGGSNANDQDKNDSWGTTGNDQTSGNAWEKGNDDQNKNFGWETGNNDQTTSGWGIGGADDENVKSNSDRDHKSLSRKSDDGWGNGGDDNNNSVKSNKDWNNKSSSKKSDDGWDNNQDKPTSQAGDAWNTVNIDQKPSSKKSEPKSSHHSSRPSSTRKSSGLRPPPSTSPRAYWATWNATKPTSRDGFSDHFSDLSAKAPKSKKVYLEPEEPLLSIPSEHAKKERLDHQVRAGKGAEYHHRIGRPEYLDSLEKPYAVFRFKYRSRDALHRILGKGVLDDDLEELFAETHNEEDVKNKLLGLSKEEILEAMMKLRSSSAVSKSHDKRSERSHHSEKKSEHSGHGSSHKSQHSRHSSGSKKEAEMPGAWDNDAYKGDTGNECGNDNAKENADSGWDNDVAGATNWESNAKKESEKGSSKKISSKKDENNGWGNNSVNKNDTTTGWGENGGGGSGGDVVPLSGW